jgi:hypothetical protein
MNIGDKAPEILGKDTLLGRIYKDLEEKQN